MNEVAPSICEECGHPIGAHDTGDAADCIARFRGFYDRTDPVYDKLEVSLRHAQDVNAALALFWWIHYAAEEAFGESWPWTWEDSLRAVVDSQRKRDARDPSERACAVARGLRKAAGGWWQIVDKDPVFVASKQPKAGRA